MIIDADSHYTPDIEIFKNISDPRYLVHYRKNNCYPDYINQRWEKLYNSVRESDWSTAGSIDNFHLLPEFVRQSLHDNQSLKDLKVFSDLSGAYIDNLLLFNAHLSFTDYKKALTDFLKSDRQLLNPQPDAIGLRYDTESTLAVELMQIYNRATIDICHNDPRFDATCWLALQDLDASLKELDYAIEQGFFGAFILSDTAFSFLPEYEPLFKKCAEHKFPVYLHLSRSHSLNLDWVIDNPAHDYLYQNHWTYSKYSIESLLQMPRFTIAGLITEGILDRYPDLRIVVAELDVDWYKDVRKALLAGGYPDPMPYFKRNFWTTAEVEHPDFLVNARELGFDRLLFATDFPHSDPGGDNRYNDINTLNDLLNSKAISQEEYDLVSYKNYEFLRTQQPIQ